MNSDSHSIHSAFWPSEALPAAPSGMGRLGVVWDQPFRLTPRGQAQLDDGSTNLADHELGLLIRLDGRQSLGNIARAMPGVDSQEFASAFRSLRDRKFLAPVELDPRDVQLQSSLDSFSATVGGAQVDAGLMSLRQTGYYCGIARPRPAGERQRVPGAPLTALVVEDEPVLAKFIQSYLGFEGIQSRLAGNRAEVVAQLRSRPVPDLVLLDVTLPDTDGFSILERIRAHPVLREVPVIMLTGKATREAVLQGMAAGADGYVTKPFEAATLTRAVRTVLNLDMPTADASSGPWLNADAQLPGASARARGA